MFDFDADRCLARKGLLYTTSVPAMIFDGHPLGGQPIKTYKDNSFKPLKKKTKTP